jgi:hypothetical protein
MNNKIMSQTKADFIKTGLSIPESILILSIEKQIEVYNYLIQMTESQKKAYLIAKEHLGTSFNILKSNGFIEWKKSIF